MFKDIRKCLDELEAAIKSSAEPSEDQMNILSYSELHLAEALMKSKIYDSAKIARFIMAEKGFEIKI